MLYFKRKVSSLNFVLNLYNGLYLPEFSDYFAERGFDCEHVHIKGSLHPITVHYLDTILLKTCFVQELKDSDAHFDGLLTQFEENLGLEREREISAAETTQINQMSEGRDNDAYSLVCQGCKMSFDSSQFTDYVVHVASCSTESELVESISEETSLLEPQGSLVSENFVVLF